MIITKNQQSFILVAPDFSLRMDTINRYNKTTCACSKGTWAAAVNLHSFLMSGTRCRSMVGFTPQLPYSQGKTPVSTEQLYS